MSRIHCDVEYEKVENATGQWLDGVMVTCSGCEAMTESYGQSQRSVDRCLVLMHDKCECDGDDKFFTTGD